MPLVPTIYFWILPTGLHRRYQESHRLAKKGTNIDHTDPAEIANQTQDGIMLINSCVSMSRVMMCHALKTCEHDHPPTFMRKGICQTNPKMIQHEVSQSDGMMVT